MKLDKLTRQIRRDLLASPKKAAALGLMVLVALYFWAPMVWGWIAPGKGAKPAARVADLILEDEPVAATASGAKANKKGFRWEKARQQMASDQRMSSAALGDDWRNPFQNQVVLVRPEETAEGEIVHVPVVPPDIHPSTAGLVLRSVLMGPRGRAASISGEVFREGELIVGDKGDAASPLEFRLLRVTRYAVELERNGKTFWLEIERARMAKGDAITSDQRD